jgi:circadian clock protein KaiC
MHTFRISSAGIAVFPAALVLGDTRDGRRTGAPRSEARLAMGVPRLDDMLGGGLPAGYSLLVAGPSGSGKTILATAFLAEGVRRGEPGVIVAFEQTPSQSLGPHHRRDGPRRARRLDQYPLSWICRSTRSLQRLIDLIQRMKATRVVIDSLSGFELAVAPTFREDFRESLFRMVAVLSGLGVTVLMTSELEDRYIDLRFSPYGSAFLTDAIIVQRYIEVESRLKRVMAVVKVRGQHPQQRDRQYEITDDGIVIGDPMLDYEGLLSGQPRRTPASDPID